MDTKKANRLINEKSPYLLQHAYNPVDWYPWGDEAFEAAKKQDRPVFMSIGYSTCHWCHVMAHESFEDDEVAKILNEGFICIKVDREERPDIDSLYMRFCQAATGAGGWPLTIIMTPEQKPFYAGTYLPKRGGYGRPGLIELLTTVLLRWSDSRDELEASGDRICDFLNRPDSPATSEKNPTELIFSAFSQLEMLFDEKNGGFAKAPKFPMPHQLLFLMKYYRQLGDDRAKAMLTKTLDQMYRGGIFDHIGGGFSRYSTDNKWLVPHFEQMLYDNALLSLTYSEAFNCTGDELYREIACLSIDYVLREMTDEEGGFFCAQDADSQGEEGSFYTFRQEEILKLLGEKTGSEFCRRYGIDEKGNFEGKSIANLLGNDDYRQARDGMDDAFSLLLSYRKGRMELHRDDKELASWNALMIASLSRSSFLLERKDYLETAIKSQKSFEIHFARDDGSLSLRWRDGEAATNPMK